MKFFKFDGAGNDFVIIDNREGHYRLTQKQIQQICDRRVGVGADGFMMINKGNAPYDFEMKFYNSDGAAASMCGNGGRCITICAYMLNIPCHSKSHKREYYFLGPDGPHRSLVEMWSNKKHTGLVRLMMSPVKKKDVKPCLDGWFLDTGSPHYVQWVKDLWNFDVYGEGYRIRHMTDLFPKGTNVDFVELDVDDCLMVRTFERGVEDETWACGTGVTACALMTGRHHIKTYGGNFVVGFDESETGFDNVSLMGPVSLNFVGEWFGCK